MNTVYNKNTSDIVAQIPDDQDYLTFFYHYPKGFKDQLSVINSTIIISGDLRLFKVADGNIISKNKEEITKIFEG